MSGLVSFNDKVVFTVTLDDGALMIEPMGKKKTRLFAESSSTFQTRTGGIRLSFVAGESGQGEPPHTPWLPIQPQFRAGLPTMMRFPVPLARLKQKPDERAG
jgi:hypothetical protein